MSYASDALIDAQSREIEKLKTENERLAKRLAQYGLFREVVGDPAHEFANLRRGLHRVERENAKLRELVRELYNRLNDNDENCGECRSSCDYDAWNFGDPKCIYAKRLRALGIEAG